MSGAKDFLVEIGTEELPPKALRSLMNSFRDLLVTGIDDARLSYGDVQAYASPRRLAVMIRDLAEKQPDRDVEQKGPPTRIAFDDDGNATPAAKAFASKCGVAIEALKRVETEKGEWLVYESKESGRPLGEIVPDLINAALAGLPIPRRMRWGAGEAEFVRPVHWVVLLHGDDVIEADIMGISSGNQSRGHRFHADGAVAINSPADYLDTLETGGYVIADFERRRDMVRSGVDEAARAAGGEVVDGEDLYDEVAALVEWPVPITGSFDDAFLSLPREVIVSTLTGHQRYFPVAAESGELLPRFITVANIESRDAEQVRDGNERVIRPRLADAAFFWDSDRKEPLAARVDGLQNVVYQKGLGSVFDKSERIAELASWIAKSLDRDPAHVNKAAMLAKCDLVTGMVGEFPELQGVMGRYYAQQDGEADEVADAIGEHYRPRFALDDLPATRDGQILALADKLDTLAGVFAIGKKPSGNRDPFGLRRAALGVVRLLIEAGLDIDLKAAIARSIALQPTPKEGADELAGDLYGFVTDRLRRYFLDRDPSLGAETFESVMVRQPSSLLDFDRRLAAVQTFSHLEQAESLAAANKRIANILRKADSNDGGVVNRKLLQDDAEVALYSALENAERKVEPLLKVRGYAEVLNELAELRDPVDRFFDDVMVMADDESVRNNRLALLGELRSLFLNVADISRLSLSSGA